MKEQIAFIKENVWLFTIAGYGLGILYMSIYYYYFDVPIVNYLSLNDILLVTVTLIIPVGISMVIFEYLTIALRKVIYKRKLNVVEETRFSFYCVIIIFILLIIAYFIHAVRINPNLLFYILFISFVLTSKLIRNVNGSNFVFVISFSLLGFFLGLYYLINYGKAGFANIDVKFNYYDEVVTTGFNHDLNYIGETSSTIFLHNFKKKVTYVYEKSNISKLTYINKINKEFSEKKELKLYALNTVIKRDSTTVKNKSDSTETNYKRYEWSTFDNKTYWWTSEKNPIGLSRLMWELNYILDENDLDFEDPSHQHSSLPGKLNAIDDYKAISDAINSGNCELHKRWETNSGDIDLTLSKKSYSIVIDFKKKIK